MFGKAGCEALRPSPELCPGFQAWRYEKCTKSKSCPRFEPLDLQLWAKGGAERWLLRNMTRQWFDPTSRWRERNCRQAISAAFSMSYELHQSRWMLTRESSPCLAVCACCAGGRSGTRTSIRALSSTADASILAPATPHRRRPCVVLTRNIAGFNLFQQIVPDGRAPFYRI
jgi:hypothetical protein